MQQSSRKHPRGPRGATTAAPAAFLLFAALLGVSRADASLPKAADAADLSRPALQLPAVASESSLFGFAEDLSLLAPESTPGRFGLFGPETSRFERTYTRNNPLKYVDPDGRQTAVANQMKVMTDPTAQAAAQFLASGASAARAGATGAAVTAALGPPLVFGALYAPGFLMSTLDVGHTVTASTAAVEVTAGAAGVTVTGASVHALFKSAEAALLRASGTGAQKAALFEGLLGQVTAGAQKLGDDFKFGQAVTEQGAHVFAGELGSLRVIDAAGNVYKGQVSTGIKYAGGNLTVVYENLQKMTSQ